MATIPSASLAETSHRNVVARPTLRTRGVRQHRSATACGSGGSFSKPLRQCSMRRRPLRSFAIIAGRSTARRPDCEQIALYHSSPLSVAADSGGVVRQDPHDGALEIYFSIQQDTAPGVQYFGLDGDSVARPNELRSTAAAPQASIRLMNQLSSLVQTSSLPTRSSTPCSRFGLSLTSMTTIAPSVSLMSTP